MMSLTKSIATCVSIAGGLALVACGNQTMSTPREPAHLLLVAGDAQHGLVGTLLPNVIQFEITDGGGSPVPGVAVNLAVTDGSGSISAPHLTTDEQGRIAVDWTLGDLPGTQELTALVDGLPTTRATAISCLHPDCPGPVLDKLQVLELNTYEGSGQVVHPDVAVGDGNLASLWLAVTPYPNGNANYENPSIFSGIDGAAWTVPQGLTNPVEHPPIGSYLSDPDIVFDRSSAELWLYYRGVIGRQNIVFLTQSGDGVHWNTPVPVVTVPSHQAVSPTVVHGGPGASWTMWSVNSGANGCSAPETTVERRTSPDGVTWSAASATDLSQPGQVIWHLDVEWLPSRSEYWAIYNTYPPGGSCTTGALYLARSADGVHWTTFPTPVARRGVIPAFADIIYRSTFTVDSLNHTVTFWISGARYDPQSGYTWRMAMLTRQIDDLFATITTPAATLITPPRRDLPPPEPDIGRSSGGQ